MTTLTKLVMKTLYLILASIAFSSCNKQIKEANFEGMWLETTLASETDFNAETLKKSNIYLPMLQFYKKEADSIKVYFRPDSIVTKYCKNIYDSYNTQLNEDRESMILFDYNNNEVFFWDRKRDKVMRYVKITDSLNHNKKTQVSKLFNINF